MDEQSNSPPDKTKRRFLTIATGAVGSIAAVAVAAPFVRSLMPSERAKAAGAPVEVDIGKIEPGMMISVEWRGKPVWVISRTPEMLATLPKLEGQLVDPNSAQPLQPDYCQNVHRSIKPQYLVVIGICTHLGCSPTAKLQSGNESAMGANWPGGFLCPCHGSTFDLAGRVFQGVPAPVNLEVPKYTYLSDTRLLIGEDANGA